MLGGDTTATALSATLFYLSRNPECYAKLATEIRAAFRKGTEISGKGLAGCQYLRACIDESLRMSPPTPGTLWRQLAPEEEGRGPFVVDGHVIPKGTKVGVNTYSLHHNEVSTIPLLAIQFCGLLRSFLGSTWILRLKSSRIVINEYAS